MTRTRERPYAWCVTVFFVVAPFTRLAWVLLCLVLAFEGAAQAQSRSITLAEAIVLAQNEAPAAVDARLVRDVQAVQLPAAGLSSILNPLVEFGVERGAYYNDVVAYGQLLLRFEVSGQRSARMAEADLMLRSKESRLLVSLADTAGATAEAFGAVAAARARVTEVDRGLSAADEEERIHRARLKAGDATLVDVASAEAEVGRWRQLRRTSEVALISAKSRLAQLLGDASREPTGDLLPPSVSLASGVIAPLVSAALLAESSAFASSADRVRSEAQSPLDVGPRVMRGDFGELRVGLVVGATLPLFRRSQGEVARLDGEALRASKLANVVARAAAIRATASVNRLEVARATLAELDANAIPSAERAVTSAQEAFRAGKADFFRVLLARRDLVGTRMRRLDVVELAWAAYADLLALGAVTP